MTTGHSKKAICTKLVMTVSVKVNIFQHSFWQGEVVRLLTSTSYNVVIIVQLSLHGMGMKDLHCFSVYSRSLNVTSENVKELLLVK